MSRELERAKARYEECRERAFRQASLNLSPIVGMQIHLSGWTGRARQEYDRQWMPEERHGDGGWDWHGIHYRYQDPDRLLVAVWCQDYRLSALALGTCQADAVMIRFLEGDPRKDCPLKGRRALIVLEAAALYAQARGRRELRLREVNSSLESLYRDIYGFTLETPWKQEPYWRKEV